MIQKVNTIRVILILHVIKETIQTIDILNLETNVSVTFYNLIIGKFITNFQHVLIFVNFAKFMLVPCTLLTNVNF